MVWHPRAHRLGLLGWGYGVSRVSGPSRGVAWLRGLAPVSLSRRPAWSFQRFLARPIRRHWRDAGVPGRHHGRRLAAGNHPGGARYGHGLVANAVHAAVHRRLRFGRVAAPWDVWD